MPTMNELVSLAKSRGFVYPGSEIYGGLANSWDYGPYGVELKNNIKKIWWAHFVQNREDVVGLDSAIIMNREIWNASGHLSGFSDPLIDCKECKNRFRADHLVEEYSKQNNVDIKPDAMSNQELVEFIKDNNIACPNCKSHNFTDIRQFNLMFKTFQGVTEDTSTELFLRPETCQGIFVNFKNIARTSRQQVPFGVAQIGKVFRNEITPGNFIYRIREFEQMELEYFCKPNQDQEYYEFFKNDCMEFLKKYGIKQENLRLREHDKEELSHYSSGTSDIEYNFPFGWGELWGIACRTDFDLSKHMEYSKEDLRYQDPITNEKYVPYVVEPSVGVDRLFLTFLADAFEVQELEDGSTRNILHLHPDLAPVKVAVLPLTKKLNDKAKEVFNDLKVALNCEYDEKGNIGKRYRRQDEIGTPYCITVDFDTLEDNTVTVRNRDTMQQERVAIDNLGYYIFSGMTKWKKNL